MKYKVHVYAVARVPIDVEAKSQTEAIKLAEAQIDPATVKASGEYAEEIVGFLVDEFGDEDHSNSKSYDAAGNLEQPYRGENDDPPVTAKDHLDAYG